MRNATCVETQTSNTPTQVDLLSILDTVVESLKKRLAGSERGVMDGE